MATTHPLTNAGRRRTALPGLRRSGLLAAVAVMLLLGSRVQDIGSDLLGSIRLGAVSWILIAALPILGAALAMLVARVTVLKTLRRML